MHKDTRINVVEMPTEFFIALRDSTGSDLHPDDARQLLVDELHRMADLIQGPVIITPEMTRAGVYRIWIDLQDARRRPFLGRGVTSDGTPGRDVTDLYLEGPS